MYPSMSNALAASALVILWLFRGGLENDGVLALVSDRIDDDGVGKGPEDGRRRWRMNSILELECRCDAIGE